MNILVYAPRLKVLYFDHKVRGGLESALHSDFWSRNGELQGPDISDYNKINFT